MQRRIAWALGLLLVAGASWAAVGSPSAAPPGKSGRTIGSGDTGSAEHPRIVRRVEVLRGGVDGGYLGVTLGEVARDDVARLKLGEERGARVVDVLDETPAAKAGLKTGDVIVKYQGEAVRSALQLRRLVRETPPERAVELEVVRDGAPRRVSVELGQPAQADLGEPDFNFDLNGPHELAEGPDAPSFRWRGKDHLMLRGLPPFADLAQPRRLGLSYQEISGQLARYFRLEDERGVLVAEVDEDGPAGRAGLKAGDVIVKLDGKAVRDGSDLRAALAGTQAGQQVGVQVWRDGQPLDLQVELGGEPRRPRPGGTT